MIQSVVMLVIGWYPITLTPYGCGALLIDRFCSNNISNWYYIHLLSCMISRVLFNGGPVYGRAPFVGQNDCGWRTLYSHKVVSWDWMRFVEVASHPAVDFIHHVKGFVPNLRCDLLYTCTVAAILQCGLLLCAIYNLFMLWNERGRPPHDLVKQFCSWAC